MMSNIKAIAIRPAKAMPSNFTDEDALSHARHHYPNPGPLLQDLFDRFEALIRNGPEKKWEETSKEIHSHAQTMLSAGNIICENCGSELSIKLEDLA